jgi:Ca2+-binding EF-hand superfamily protein
VRPYGPVDFEEFLLVMAGGKKDGSYDKKALLRAFKSFKDKTLPNGFISPEALEAALVDYCRVGITPEAAMSLVAQLEKDDNGNINYLDKVNTFCN